MSHVFKVPPEPVEVKELAVDSRTSGVGLGAELGSNITSRRSEALSAATVKPSSMAVSKQVNWKSIVHCAGDRQLA